MQALSHPGTIEYYEKYSKYEKEKLYYTETVSDTANPEYFKQVGDVWIPVVKVVYLKDRDSIPEITDTYGPNGQLLSHSEMSRSNCPK